MIRTPRNRARDLARFYAPLDRLREQQGGYRHLRDCTARAGWPARGVYFSFEPGEVRAGGERLRDGPYRPRERNDNSA